MGNNKYSKLKIVWFPKKIISLSNNEITAPIYVRIKPTNKCNHNCFFCAYSFNYSNMHETTVKQDEIPREKMMEILDNFKEIGVKAITYSGGGEPLVYPHIEETLQKTLDHNLDLSIITNGQSLTGRKAELLAKAKWVRVSVDYFDEESFKKSRRVIGENFHKIKENIKNFNEIRNKNCDLEINFVVHEFNKSNLYESAKLFEGLGVDNIRFSPVWNKDFYDFHKKIKDEVDKQLESARKDLETEEFKIYDSYGALSDLCRTYGQCYMMQILPVIGADCKIYTCHNKAYDREGIIGDIKNKSFKEVWFSEEAKRFFKNFNPKESCNTHQCTNDKKNTIINEILNVKEDNFV